MSYKEFEIDTIGHKGELNPFTFNLANISYYRAFVESSSDMDKKSKLVTMIYLVGSIKAIQVNCSYDTFKSKIKEITE